MSIWAHFRELRKRILLAAIGIFLGAFIGWYLYNPVMNFITAPLADVTAPGKNQTAQLNFQTIGAAFDLKLKVSLWISLILTSPWWVGQIFAFIAPGLKKREKIYLTIFGAAGVLLFLAGTYSGVQLAPKAVEILTSFTPENAAVLLQAESYVSFYMRLVAAFGLSFLIPEILVVLNFLRLLSAKRMLKSWRTAVISAFTFAAIANPLPQPWPMIVQALILITLYLLAVGICAINDFIRTRKRRTQKQLIYAQKR
ncbi:twin-arginine translocase subunit TatC [Arcanobacterium hippocoleae]